LKELGVSYFYATKASPSLSNKEFEKIKADKTAIKDSLAILLSLSSEFGMVTDILECYPLCFISEVEKFEKFTRHKCRGGITSATISSNGDLRSCSHSDQNYGNIFTEPLERIWMKMDEWRDNSLIPQTCLSCTHFRRCSGGCRMEAKYYGKIDGMDPFASRPEDVVLSRVDGSEENELRQIMAGEKLKITADLKKRREKFGGVLKAKEYIFINEGLWNLVESLETKGIFRINEIVSGYGFEREQVLDVFNLLYRNGIVKISKKEVRKDEPRNT